MLTLLLGGARSGKSTLAVQMAERQSAPVTFVATAEPFDDDLRDRIVRHRLERPPHWATVECPVELAGAVRAVSDLLASTARPGLQGVTTFLMRRDGRLIANDVMAYITAQKTVAPKVEGRIGLRM